MEFKLYVTDKGASPIDDYLDSLPIRDQMLIDAKIQHAKKYNQFTRDFYTKFKGFTLDIGELRIGNHRIIVLRVSSDTFVLLHAFRKKTNETPEREMRIGYNRAIDYLRRNPFQ